uniref:Uncharacterized protein n=1 Tax=Bracon brevicornis TaxID=1563983 RepID=A0A6V7IMK7_9HYME
MSVLSTLALRMITQVGYQTSLRLYEKCEEYAICDRVNQGSPSGIVQKFDTLHMSESAKRPLKRKKHTDEKASTKDTSERLDSRAYQLVGHESLRTPSDFFERTLMAAFLLKCLTIVDFFGTSKENIGTDSFSYLCVIPIMHEH